MVVALACLVAVVGPVPFVCARCIGRCIVVVSSKDVVVAVGRRTSAVSVQTVEFRRIDLDVKFGSEVEESSSWIGCLID